MRYITIVLVFAFAMTTSLAQNDACPTLVQRAIDTTSSNCIDIGRNQVCYGNVQIEVEPSDSGIELAFTQGGDIANVSDIASLRLSSLVTPTEWGVALLSIQANLPNTLPGQNVTILLFGDVAIENAGSLKHLPILINVMVNSGINVRSGAGTNFAVVRGLNVGDVVVADGRNEAGDWLRVQLPDEEGIGWVYLPLITVEGDVSALDVVSSDDTDESQSKYGPMQSFTFRSGIGDPACAEAPRDGILIQTPEGVGTIDLLINEVQISLGSTAYLQAIPNGNILVALLEGQSTVKAQDKSVTVPAGTQAVIPADVNGLADGAPILETLDLDKLTGLPISLLPREIEIAEPIEIGVLKEGLYRHTVSAEYFIPCALRDRGDFNYEIGPIVVGGLSSTFIESQISIAPGVYFWETVTENGTPYAFTYTVISPTEVLVTENVCGTVLPDYMLTYAEPLPNSD